MRKSSNLVRSATVLGVLALGACTDRSVVEPALQPTVQRLAEISCTANVKAHTVACALPSRDGSYRPLIVGGQNMYVALASSNIQVVADTFQFDATVQNLIPQALGTTDGIAPDPSGVQLFFSSGPAATGGTGNVTVANADGTGTFTDVNQPYFQYAGLLGQNQTSAAKTWKLQFDPGVTQIGFRVYVSAAVEKPNGWVTVSPATPYLLAGSSQALTAVSRNAVGDSLTGAITWQSSNPAVATVDSLGNVTAVAAGSVQITATEGPRSSVQNLAVCPNLAVGDVYTATMPSAASTCFGGGAGTEEFTYMPINLSTSSSLSLTVTGTGIQAVTGPPTPDRIPAGATMLRSLDQGLTIVSDAGILERDARELSPKLAVAAARRANAARNRPRGLHTIVTPNAVPSVGDLMDLNTNSACSGSPSVRTGQVRSVSQHLIIVSDTSNPAGGFTTAQYDSIALEFDTIAWPVDSANFGAPTDEDNNGHVVAFFTRAVNELSPPASSSVVLGFFASKDVFGTDDCSNSNGQPATGAELFYMLVPDPTGAVNSNVRTVSFVRGNTTGTLGHEFQHMINGMRRAYITGASFFEQGYLNEGLSHIAEELMFYRTSVGLAPRQNIVLSTLTTGPNASRRVAAFNTYANQNYGRLRSWLQRPDTAGAFRPNANSLAVRGAIWAFLRYAADRVNGNDQTFWYNMVNSNLEGTANIQNAIGGAAPNDWLRDFTAAMYADDSGVAVASQYTNPSWSYRSLYGGLNGSYQLVPRALTNNTPLTLSYASGGGTSYARFGTAASSFSTVTALSGGVAPTSPYTLIVVRTK